MEQININNQPKRPQLLTVLAILSFIGSGLSLLSYLVISFYYDAILAVIETELKEVYPALYADFIREAGRTFFIVGSLAYAGSLFGVYKMWNLMKEGLHYYAVSQFIILLLPLVFVSAQLSVIPGLMLTIVFVLLYYQSFKMIENGK